MSKKCDKCNRPTYKVRGWWQDAEVTYICNGCNIESDSCECPKTDELRLGVPD